MEVAIAKKTKTKLYNFRLKNEVGVALKNASDDLGHSMTEIIEVLIEDYLPDLSARLLAKDEKDRHNAARRILAGKGPIDGAIDEAKIEKLVELAVARAIESAKK